MALEPQFNILLTWYNKINISGREIRRREVPGDKAPHIPKNPGQTNKSVAQESFEAPPISSSPRWQPQLFSGAPEKYFWGPRSFVP